MDSATDSAYALPPAYPIGLQVGIPWREHPSRLTAFQSVSAWYRRRGIQVIAGEAPDRLAPKVFNLSAARNWLVSQMTSEVMILTDADTLVEDEPLLEAINAAYRDNLVHLPYHLYRDSAGTFTEGATSGTFVFTRKAWESTNGQDERFEGWGYEDSAWRLAHLTLNGPIPRHRGIAVAELHAPAPRDQTSQNARLHKLYRDAYGNYDQMLKLVHEKAIPVETHQDRVNARIAHQNRLRPLGSPRRA